jgi:hypothetical protein
LYRIIKEFRKGYQPRINIIKDENGNVLTHPHSVLNRWKNFFNHELNLHRVHDVMQMDIHVAEPLVPEPSLVKVETATGKLKWYKSLGMDHILAELTKQEVKHYVLRYTNLLFLYGLRRNCHRRGRNLLLYQLIRVVRL